MKTLFLSIILLFIFLPSSGADLPQDAWSNEIQLVKLTEKALQYYQQGDYEKAVPLFKELANILETSFGKEFSGYVKILNNLAVCYIRLGNYNEAIRLLSEAMKIREKALGKEHPDYATCLGNLANCYFHLGKYDEAIRLHSEAMKIREKRLGREHPDYATSLSCLANCYSDLGNYDEAIRLYSEAMKIREKALGKEHPDYATTLHNLAACYSDLGNYVEAIRLHSEAMKIFEKALSRESQDYATSLNNIAQCFCHVGDYNEAIRLHSEAMKIREKALGKEHPDYANSISNLANCYFHLGKYDEAIRLHSEAMKIREKRLGREHPSYAATLNNLAVCYIRLGNYNEAIRLHSEAMKIREKALGKEHPDYANSISNLASCYENLDILEFSLYFKKYLDLKSSIILNSVQGLSSVDQRAYWISENYNFRLSAPQKAFKYNNDILNGCAYDASLLSKGFLLGAETETKKLIQESGDAALIAKYDEMVMTRRMLDKLLEKPLNERRMDADSLRNVITNLERDVMAGSRAYGNLKKNMSIKWQDVQGKLGKGDVAVEFLSFPVSEDSTMYVAFTIKKSYKSPKQIPLFEEKQLKALGKEDLYTGNALYDLVWKPLEEELRGARNVYFSPSGELYNINIEVLPGMSGNDKGRNYWRLSSTRQLAYTRDDKASQGASVYGGIRYNADTEALEADSKNFTKKTRSWDENLLSTDSINVRGGWRYLRATLTEATEVDETMTKSRVMSNLYTGAAGTEASFKALDGTGRKYLHIATHGFYYTDRDTVQMKGDGLGFTLLGKDRVRGPKFVEDKSLTRSGLLFAGCNNKLTGKDLPEGVEDGILFAKEIANLDLRGMDLVTLSACETGLGDITGEGVFGLQRAFKKAGAQSILMSLWKVDDDATQLFMNRFYENYLSKKMTKSESLKDAQQYLRTFDGGIYDNPIYWAAFILLDAM